MSAEYIEQYLAISIFLFIAIILSLLVSVLPKFLANETKQEDKLKSYECGFDSFEDARIKFDIRFYLVAILFIIFDLEVVFLIPWAISLKQIGYFGYFSMMFFLLVLGVGFLYEWKKGALEWE